jgi:hypothetical protein
MKSRVAKKVFLAASQRITGHSKLTLAKAARKVLKDDITPEHAWACFFVLAAQRMWPYLDLKMEKWLNDTGRTGFDPKILRR